ncbi:CWF19-like protein 2 [Linum perenne]
MRQKEEQRPATDGQRKQTPDRSYLKDVSVRHPEMRAPKVRDSLSWGKQKTPKVSANNAIIISSAASSLNKFANNGNFMNQVLGQTNDLGSSNAKLEQMVQPQIGGSSNSRYVAQHNTRKKDDNNADKNLARTIMQNKQYSLSGRADDEYDYEDGPRKKSRKKEKDSDRKSENINLGRRIVTQQERCMFCFENPNRPKHLVLSIANFTYLMLPQRKPVVPGHCCILPLQHESSTRTVDDNVWEEIRNFKKCLIMMFAKQDKEVVFLETVMGLSQQRRHCLVECIPLPQGVAKEAPLYFKKAIDEAEDEWSQHNAKKLIDTSVKGLRGSIPKDFPYFHVEFGLNKGFVHVIDDESQFNGSLGLNVIRGIMQLPEEDMYRRRRQDSVQGQKLAVAEFVRDWQPFDWTKQL